MLDGDRDQFFALAALEVLPNESIVLEDSEAPAPIMAKINTVLDSPPLASQQENDSLAGGNYDTYPGMVRRLRPRVLVVALGRNADVAHLKVKP